MSDQDLGLCAADCKALAELDQKLELVRDRVKAVVGGYATGLYLCGAGGLGKSYRVLKQLQDLDADYRLFNSRMTGKGLFRALERAPDAVHVLEDMERLTKDLDAQGVLRSALWCQPDDEREVTWTTASEGEQRFVFMGGIIMLANRPLANLPELRALATRIAVVDLDISDGEMAAQIRRIAQGGFSRGKHKLGAEQCQVVAEYLIGECKRASCPLDMRLFDNACLDYLQWDAHHSACHWHDLVANRVGQNATHFRHELTNLPREEELAADRELVREICRATSDAQERVRVWHERTGHSPATFYRRKKEVDLGELD
jgi:hypothetical protein